MDKNELTHEESLQIIQRMINEVQNRLTENGFHFLLWGVLVIIASLTQFFMIVNNPVLHSYYVWFAMPLIGIPIAFIYEWKKNKKNKTKTHSEKLFGLLWLGFGITITVVIFAAIYYKISPMSFILAFVGLATFVSGCIYKFKPLILGSIIFWISSIACVFIINHHQLLVMAIATLLGYILPGILLWKKSKTQSNV